MKLFLSDVTTGPKGEVQEGAQGLINDEDQDAVYLPSLLSEVDKVQCDSQQVLDARTGK